MQVGKEDIMILLWYLVQNDEKHLISTNIGKNFLDKGRNHWKNNNPAFKEWPNIDWKHGPSNFEITYPSLKSFE